QQTAPRPPGVPDRIWAAICACLSKDPAGRPTADDLADAMRQAAIDTGDLPAATPPHGLVPLPAGSPLSPPPPATAPGRVTALPAGPGRVKRRSARGHRPGPRVGALVAALAIAATGTAAAAAYRIGLDSRTTTGTHTPGATPTASPDSRTAPPARSSQHGVAPTPGAGGTPGTSPAAHPSTSTKPRRATKRPRPKRTTRPAPSHTPAPPASSPPPVTAWQCGPIGPAPLADGKATGQTLQACVRVAAGELQLQGTLTGVDPTAKEQLSLVPKNTS